MELTGKNYTRNDWRKLLSTRRGTVIVAGVCAILAAVILIVAMNGYRNHVNTSGSQETVLVATGLIPKGTSADAIASEQLFKPTSLAAKQVSAGAIADTAALHGEVAVADIEPGQQLTRADFTARGGLATQLAPDQRAMTLTLPSANGMVGQIQTGDHVDVYGGWQLAKQEEVERLLIPNVPVLIAGTASSTGLGNSSPQNQQSNITLQIPSEDAGKLAFAAEIGKVWLVLRAPHASEPTSASITANSLLLGTRQGTTGGKK